MSDAFWKAKERRILRQWFGTSRIGSTGKPSPDGITGSEAIEIFTYRIPKKILAELAQAEKACGADLIPWVIFGPKGGRDEDMLIATKLKYVPRAKERGALQTSGGNVLTVTTPDHTGQSASPHLKAALVGDKRSGGFGGRSPLTYRRLSSSKFRYDEGD